MLNSSEVLTMFHQIIFPLLLILLLPVWLRLLVRLRLGPALIYVVLGNTVWLDWAAQHTALADGIWDALRRPSRSFQGY